MKLHHLHQMSRTIRQFPMIGISVQAPQSLIVDAIQNEERLGICVYRCRRVSKTQCARVRKEEE